MALVILVLGLAALFLVFAYYMVIATMVAMGVTAALIYFLSEAVWNSMGPAAGIATAVFCVLTLVLFSVGVQWKQRKEERLRRERALQQEALNRRLRDAAIRMPWQNRSAKDWLRVLF